MKKSDSTIYKGDYLENKLYNILSNILDKNKFITSSNNSILFRKKGYYSKKRETNIIFDVTIEAYLPGNSKYSNLFVFECKNLKSNISVDDIEEFGSKLNQVGEHNTKGFIVTTTQLQKSAYKIAKSEGIGVIIINNFDGLDYILPRKNNLTYNKQNNHSNRVFSLIAIDEDNYFYSIFDILEYHNIIGNINPLEFLEVDYISYKKIDLIINSYDKYNLYTNNKLDVNKTTHLINNKYNFSFIFNEYIENNYLGLIDFSKSIIRISNIIDFNSGIWRFTLAHEIGHLILHIKYFHNTNKSLFDSEYIFNKIEYEKSNNDRLELQANHFASVLLMPTIKVKQIATVFFKRNRINKNYIYLDNQSVNISLANNFIKFISDYFNVSKQCASNRLSFLKLLIIDQPKKLSWHLSNFL